MALVFGAIVGFGFKVVVLFDQEKIIWSRQLFSISIPGTSQIYSKNDFNRITLKSEREKSNKSTFPSLPLGNVNFDITEAFLHLSSSASEMALVLPMFSDLKTAKELAQLFNKHWAYSISDLHKKRQKKHKSNRNNR